MQPDIEKKPEWEIAALNEIRLWCIVREDAVIFEEQVMDCVKIKYTARKLVGKLVQQSINFHLMDTAVYLPLVKTAFSKEKLILVDH